MPETVYTKFKPSSSSFVSTEDWGELCNIASAALAAAALAAGNA